MVSVYHRPWIGLHKITENHRVCYLGFDSTQINRIRICDAKLVEITEELSLVAERIKYDFIDYVASIGEKQVSQVLWWATRMASKSNSQTDFFSIVCLILVAKKLVRTRGCEAIITSDPRVYFMLRRNFEFLSPISSFLKAGGEYLGKALFSIVKMFLGRSLWFGRTIVKNRRVRKYLQDVGQESNFIYSWVEDRSFSEDGCYGDPYMPGLDEFRTNTPTVLLIPYYVKCGLYPKLKLARKDIAGLPFYSRLSKAIQACFCFAMIRFHPYFKGVDYGFLWRDEILYENCTTGLCENVHDYLCWKEFFRRARGKLIYPYENQPWEKMMILARNEVGGSVRLIGYQHSAIGRMHLSYHTTPREISTMPVPDVIVLNSEETEELYKKYYAENEKVRVINGGALRYSREVSIGQEQEDRKRLGVFLPIDRNLSRHIIDHLNALHQDRFDIIMKPHPNLPVSRKELRPEYQIFEGSAVELYKIVDGVVYCSSSAGLEAYSYGLPVFRVTGQFLDLEIGEDSFSPHIIKSITDISEDQLKHHPAREVFGPVNQRIWRSILK